MAQFASIPPIQDNNVDTINRLITQLNERHSDLSLTLAQIQGLDGRTAVMSNNLDMNQHRIVNVKNAKANTDVPTVQDLRQNSIYGTVGEDLQTSKLIVADAGVRVPNGPQPPQNAINLTTLLGFLSALDAKVAPPKVANASSIGTFTGRFSREQHTHQGVNLDDPQTITGLKQLGNLGQVTGKLNLAGITSGLVSLTVADAAGTWTLTLPITGGTNGYVLTTDGTGITTWTNPAGLPGVVPSTRTLAMAGTTNQIAVSPTGPQDLSANRTWTFSLVGPYTPATYTAHGVLLGEGTSSIVATAVGTNGQLLIGSTGADPVFATLGTGTGISITPGAGTLTITNTGATSVTNSDGTLTITPTTGAVVASINHAHSNEWTVMQVFNRNTATPLPTPSNEGITHTTGLQIGGADGMVASLALDAFGLNNNIQMRRANGTLATVVSNPSGAALLAGQLIGVLTGLGHDGTAYTTGKVQILFNTVNAWSGSDNSTKIRFTTTPTGDTVTRQVAQLQDGLTVGTTTDPGFGYINALTGFKVNNVALSSSNLSDGVPNTRTITIAGTTNQVISSAGAQDLSANRTWTLSLPQDIDTTATPQWRGVQAIYNLAGANPTLLAQNTDTTSSSRATVQAQAGTVTGGFLAAPTSVGGDSGLWLYTTSSDYITVAPNSTRKFTVFVGGGASLGTTLDPASNGVLNVATGFRIGNAAASARVLRGDGTNFVSAQLAAVDLSNGTTGSGSVVLDTAPTIAGGAITGLTTLAIRDTSAAFDVTLAATSATALTAGRTLTLDMGNVAHTLAFGTTANTITFPSVASDTVTMIAASQSLTNKKLGSLTTNGPIYTSGGDGTLNSEATLAYARGGTNASTSWTQGSVLFAGASAFAQDNSKFFWDATNHRLGIGLATPDSPITISDNSSGVFATTGIQIHIVGADGTSASVNWDTYGAAASFAFRRADNTLASPSTPAAGVPMSNIAVRGWTGSDFSGNKSSWRVNTLNAWSGSDNSTYHNWWTTPSGSTTITEYMRLKQGLLLLAGGAEPTGGDKGAGTLNVGTNIYLNGTAYTNPDYVLEHWATGQIVQFVDHDGASVYTGLRPLAQVREQMRHSFTLPLLAEARQRGGGGVGLFDGGDALLASLEEAYLYLLQLDERISTLERKYNGEDETGCGCR